MHSFPSKTNRPLSERLSQLKKGAAKEPPKASRLPGGSSLEALIASGNWCEKAGSRVFCVHETLTPECVHGGFQLGNWLSSNCLGLSVLAKEAKASGTLSEHTVFLDTETTGLSGGTGTVAFLIGCLSVREGKMVLQQFFMEDYGAEPLLLEKLAAVLEGARCLVTFNGKSYDSELLRTRCGLHRMPVPFRDFLHLDLLHASRRLWKDAFEDCRLSTLEKRLLSFERENDIEGHEIPQIYFDFLGGSDASKIARVFSHNRFDLLSLAALALKMNHIYESREGDHGENLPISKIHFQMKDTESALARLEGRLKSGPETKDKAGDEQKFYSMLLKNAGRHAEAAAIWKERAAKEGVPDLFAYEELAKYYEHRAKDYAKALEVTEEVLSRLKRFRGFLPRMTADMAAPFETRKKRLLAKRKLL